MPELNERQKTAMTERIAEAAKHGVTMSEYRDWSDSWHGTFKPESRPWRGHDFNGVWCDGEHFVQVTIDVYGSGYLSIADVYWKHGGEDCQCLICETERDDE